MKGMLLDRPGLLVSVRNAAEAEAAIDGGADWIDLKEPTNGPLGAVDLTTATQVADVVANRRPLSAALGELRDWPAVSSLQLLTVPDIQYVKLGLAGMESRDDWQLHWYNAAQVVGAAGKRLVPVVYADWRLAGAPAPTSVLELAEQSQANGVLIDTYDKRAVGTLQRWGASQLREFVLEANRRELFVVLAGKIKRLDLRQLPLDDIDLMAVRGAVCSNDRTSSIDQALVTEFKQNLVYSHQTARCGFIGDLSDLWYLQFGHNRELSKYRKLA